MSANYNTRRSGSGYGGQQNVGNIGQRRPVVTNNFVPGGQLSNQQKNQPGGQQQQQQRNQQGQQPGINFRNQQPQQKLNYVQQQQQPQQKQQPPQQQQQQPKPQGQAQQFGGPQQQRAQPQQQQQQQAPPPQQQQQQQAPPPQQQQQQAAPAVVQQQLPQVKQELPVTPGKPLVAGANPMAPEPMETGAELPKPKRMWNKTGNKISKKEKLRRRNLRLSRMLQPKNAVMILNELIKNPVYNVEEIPVKVDPNQYKATVSFDDQSHVGLGRSKNAAKNAAAETALKYLVKHKQLQLTVREGTEGAGDEQMDVTQDGTETASAESILPWQHVASFALFKLFSSWGEDPALTTRVSAQELLGCPKASAALTRQQENRPSKKMPANPESMNPLMLINQMLPHAQFEEVGKSGNPPNVTFSFSCVVDGETFMGTGPNKKAAKRQAAFGACHKVLGVTYSPDVYVPIY